MKWSGILKSSREIKGNFPPWKEFDARQPTEQHMQRYIQQKHTTLKSSKWLKRSGFTSCWKCTANYVSCKDNYFVFQVMFEAVRGASFQGDMALDDIGFTNGPCSKFWRPLTTFCSYMVTVCNINGNLTSYQVITMYCKSELFPQHLIKTS